MVEDFNKDVISQSLMAWALLHAPFFSFTACWETMALEIMSNVLVRRTLYPFVRSKVSIKSHGPDYCIRARLLLLRSHD